MPSATMTSRSTSGRKRLSSLCCRFIPMWVSPEKRTRRARMVKVELIARPTAYHRRDARPNGRSRELLLATRIAAQADKVDRRSDAELEPALGDVRVAVDRIAELAV